MVLKSFQRICGGHRAILEGVLPGISRKDDLVTEAHPAQLRRAFRNGDVLRKWLNQWSQDEALCAVTRPDLLEAVKELADVSVKQVS